MIYILSFIVALLFTPIVGRVAVVSGITDKVNGDPLKIHREPVALLGGVAVFIAVLVGFLVFACLPDRQGSCLPTGQVGFSVLEKHFVRILGTMFGGICVFAIGLWDDIRSVNPKFRLLVQISAGIAVFAAGIKVNFIPIHWVVVPLTLFYIAGAINAFNVIDGMDGLCAGISLVSSVGFFFLGLKGGNMVLTVLSLILFMSLLGFLPYNLHPAKIFLGDAGSGFLGFMLGLIAVMATSKPYNIANFVAPLLIIGVPVFDMVAAILRRSIQKKPLFIGDRDHLYDLLLKKEWSQPRVWCIICGMQAALVGIALFIHR